MYKPISYTATTTIDNESLDAEIDQILSTNSSANIISEPERATSEPVDKAHQSHSSHARSISCPVLQKPRVFTFSSSHLAYHSFGKQGDLSRAIQKEIGEEKINRMKKEKEATKKNESVSKKIIDMRTEALPTTTSTFSAHTDFPFSPPPSSNSYAMFNNTIFNEEIFKFDEDIEKPFSSCRSKLS